MSIAVANTTGPYPEPLIRQRADPQITRHHDGYYYFTASVPEYDRIEVRRARTITGLATTTELVDVWHKPEHGPASALIWAPELHRIDDVWVIYFAAAPSRAIKDGLFQHRMYAITTEADNPLAGSWHFAGPVDSGCDSFCLDATTFAHRGQRYYVWAQKDPAITGNSNLYLATLASPTRLSSAPVMLSTPDQPWEQRGFWVNEGPAVITHGQRIFISYSASATDENYCMGLLYADVDADLLNPASWHKSPQPVLSSAPERRIFGPGHNSFTVAEDGETDLLVYHARDYTAIEGDPLWDPNRHTRVLPIRWRNGFPHFGWTD